MSEHLKIAVIGAGSLFWGSTLVHDVVCTPELDGSTVFLMDVDRGRLQTICVFAKRYAEEAGSNVRFVGTTSRAEAIRGSDFVVNAAMAGGHQYYEKMRAISEKHGYFRGINSVEWNMVSDYHTIWGYYQFKLAREIAEDMERLSPDAWLIQVSNPVLELTTMVSRLFRIRVVGLCHGHLGVREVVAAMGYGEGEVEAESIGLNHTIWLTRFRRDGQDLYPEFDEWVRTVYPSFYADWVVAARSNPLAVQLSPAMVDMYRLYGLVPVGDTVRSGTWKYHRNMRAKKKWYGPLGGFDSPAGWRFYLELEQRKADAIRAALEGGGPLSALFPAGPSEESVVPIIVALAGKRPGKHQVNAPNRGTIDGVPDDVAVETPADVGGWGIRRETGMRLPKRVLDFSIRPRIQRMEWAIDAFLEGGKELLLEWLVNDPRTRSQGQAERAVDDLLAMPENEEMARHFR